MLGAQLGGDRQALMVKDPELLMGGGPTMHPFEGDFIGGGCLESITGEAACVVTGQTPDPYPRHRGKNVQIGHSHSSFAEKDHVRHENPGPPPAAKL